MFLLELRTRDKKHAGQADKRRLGTYKGVQSHIPGIWTLRTLRSPVSSLQLLLAKKCLDFR